jgi:hypothetical protein
MSNFLSGFSSPMKTVARSELELCKGKKSALTGSVVVVGRLTADSGEKAHVSRLAKPFARN